MQTFVARQPILDERLEVHGFELLFRDGPENVFRGHDHDLATSRIIADAPALIGSASITQGRRAYVNVTRNVLLEERYSILPAGLTVLEVLEDVAPDPDVVAAVLRAREAGYLVALDDLGPEDADSEWLAHADIAKLDFLAIPRERRAALAKAIGARVPVLVAEKVETREEFEEARDAGFGLFQGYFFSRPEMIGRREIPAGKLQILQLVQSIQQPELSFDEIEELVKQDLAICYRLLRFVNSAYYSWRTEVASVRQALVVVGENEFRKWVTVLALADLCADASVCLFEQSLARARLCESLAEPSGLGARGQECFLMGLFSQLDAMLGRPLAEVLERVPLAEDVTAALLGEPNAFRHLYDCAVAYERGRWTDVSRDAGVLGIDEAGLPALAHEALGWGRQLSTGAALAA